MNEQAKLESELFELKKEIAKLQAEASVRQETKEESTRQAQAEKRKSFVSELTQKEIATAPETDTQKAVRFLKEENTLFGIAFIIGLIGLYLLLK